MRTHLESCLSALGLAATVLVRLLLLWTLVAINLSAPAWAQAYGLTERQPMGPFLNNRFPTTAPNATTGWSTVPAFPNLTFNNPTHLTAAPRSNRLYVSTQWGRIYSFTNDPNTTTSTLFLDVSNRTQVSDSSGLLGLVFHPEFGLAGSPNRGYVYIFYTYSPTPRYGYYPCFDRLSRFTVPDGSLTADPNSETVLIQQYDPDVWHNGGGMFFDEEGFLYLSVGDAGGASDNYNTAQRLDEGLFSGVIRIDVDMDPTRSHPIRRQPISRDPNAPSYTANYYIPNDNPFLDPNGGILEEFWAIGLRSPHRMTYDRTARQIWLGDVGQTAREEINIIQRGGNYQWPYIEGTQWTSKPKPQPLIGVDQPPFFEYPHSDGNTAVMGGHVYRGTEHAAYLDGLYIFGDNGSGRIWALGTDNQATYLCNMPPGTALTGLSSFGEDLNRELYMCQMGPKGGIYKLARSSGPGATAPALLSQTGAFTNLATLTPAAGIIPYDVNSQLWSDAAAKRRWIAVPNDGAPYTAAETIGFTRTGDWSFPAGTVLIKHFELPLDHQSPLLIKRLETRFLIRDANGTVYGLTYKWRDDHSDADLLPGSLNEDITVQTPTGPRTQTWFYPSRQSCFSCHNDDASHVLGVNTRQLNGVYTYPNTGVTDNQLRTWAQIGLFNSPPAESEIAGLDRLVEVTDTSATLAHRMRSYLDANCAHCHQPGTPRGFFDARFDTPLNEQRIVDGAVAHALGISDARVVAPQSTDRSIMYRRMNTDDGSKMPTIARNVIDVAAVNTLAEWIASLGVGESLPSPWSNRDVGGTGIAGTVSYSDGTFRISGSGHDIWGNADAFHFVYQPLSGDGQITARVSTVQNTHSWAKAGVMIRESLTGDSRYSGVFVTASSGLIAQNRATAGGTTTGAPGPWGATAPYWIRLVRSAGTVAALVSSNGTSWIQIAEYAAPSGSLQIGLAVTAHDNALLNTSVFDQVVVTTQNSPAPTAPAAPGPLTASTVSSSQIDLSWTDNSTNEEGFAIERSIGGGAFSTIASVNANVTTYANTGLTASTTYTYRVRATNSGGSSAYSNAASATTSGSSSTAPPSSLTASADSPTQITLRWTDNSTSEQSFKIERSTGGASFVQIATVAADSTSYINTGLTAATSYSYRVRAAFSASDSPYSNTASAVTPSAPSPGTWSPADVGNVGLAGSFTVTDGTLTVRGSGADIWNAADGFHFAYRTLTGDGAIEAQVGSLTNTHPWAKAGVMIRDTLAGNSPNTATLLTAASGVHVQNRATTGATTTNIAGPWGTTAPYWVRLVRTGTTVVGSGSPDGVTWTTIATHAVTTPTVYIGLAVTSHDNAQLATATFNQVRITGGGSSEPTAPAAPDNLIATALSSSRIDLAWTDNSTNESGFAIERASGTGSFSSIASVGANVTTYTNTGLTASTAYTYRVRATNSVGNSAYSNAASATTLSAAGPAAPSGLVATTASASRIDLTWTDNATNETGYRVEQSSGALGFAEIALLPANSTSYAATGLAASTAYSYRVRAAADTVNSAYSAIATATTSAPPSTDNWTGVDLGVVGIAGTHAGDDSGMTIQASGADIQGTTDGFRFVYRAITGDCILEARVTSLARTHPWAKAGVMIRGALTANAANSAVLLTANNGVTVQQRSSAGATTSVTGGVKSAAAPYWVRLVRTGTSIVALSSPNGTTWTTHSTHSVALGATVYVGLAVTSHTNSALTTATFESVRLTGGGTPTLPAAPSALTARATASTRVELAWNDNSTDETGFKIERSFGIVPFTEIASVSANVRTYLDNTVTAATPYSYRVRATSAAGNSGYSNTATATTPPSSSTWLHADVGAVGVSGSDDASGINTVTVRGSGSDIWDTADGFRFLYRMLTGDGVVEANVTSLTNTHPWAKAGVMIRESLAADAANVFALVTPASGVGVQQRPAPGALTTFTSGPWGAGIPHWVRLVRTGDVIVASVSANGTTWTTVATHTVPMSATVLVGFAVTSHDNTQLSTGVFADPYIQ